MNWKEISKLLIKSIFIFTLCFLSVAPSQANDSIQQPVKTQEQVQAKNTPFYELTRAAIKTETLIWTITAIVLLIVSFTLLTIYRKKDTDEHFGFFMFVIFITCLVSLFSLIGIPIAIQTLLNLDYYTTKEIANSLK